MKISVRSETHNFLKKCDFNAVICHAIYKKAQK